jgi:U3 small nucleolar RNA-associated protein 14
MDFMKKATEQQKLRAREEAQQVLKEIEALEGGGFDSDPNEGSLETKRKGVSVEERKAAKQAVGAMFNQHDGSGFQLNFLAPSIPGSTPVTEKAIPSQSATATSETMNKKTKKEVSNVNNKTAGSANKLEESANPWLEVSTTTGNSSGKKRGMNQLGVKSRNISDEGTQEVVVSIPDTTKLFSKKDKNTKSKKADSMVSSSPGEEVEKKVLSGKTQQELVQMAFAGPDFEADFIAHKQQEIDRELGLDEKKLKILKDGTSLKMKIYA